MSEDAKAVTLDSGAVIEAIRRASAQFRALRRQDESEAPKDETPVVTILKRAMRTHLERHRTYGAGDHDRYGAVCAVLFPEGLTLRTPEEFARFHLFSMIVAKLNRYSANYVSGGHPDSVHDQGVYSFLLEAYDEGTRHGR